MSIELVFPVEGDLRASSEALADGIGQQHASVIRLIRKHQANFESLGSLRFEIRVKRKDRRGGEATEFAMLNEHQATLLLAFMRNTPKVIEFKVALVREFFRMREALQNQEQNLWAQMKALIRKEVKSEIKGTVGSLLMHGRRKEKPVLAEERTTLESQIQPKLFH